MLSNYVSGILNEEVQRFILENESADPRELVLKQKRILNVPASWVAEQISARKKSRKKIPLWYNTHGIVYPPSINLEQSSSEATASFKAGVIEKYIPEAINSIGIDLTGGFGVDTFYMSRKCRKFIYVEPNNDLVDIARNNHYVLNAKNIEHDVSTAEDFFQKEELQPDLVFIDPSRRNEARQKVYRLADCAPDITSLQHMIFTKSKFILVKTSPLLDIRQAMRELLYVRRVFVISVENECREMLFLLERNYSDEPIIEAVELDEKGRILSTFSFSESEEKNKPVLFGEPKAYIYEPHPSILKAGAFKSIASHFPVEKLSINTHLYTSSDLINDFPGRIFRVEQSEVNEKTLPNLLPDKKVNITTRNYPLSPEEIKKKYKLQDGGEKYLIGFSSERKKHLVLAVRL